MNRLGWFLAGTGPPGWSILKSRRNLWGGGGKHRKGVAVTLYSVTSKEMVKNIGKVIKIHKRIRRLVREEAGKLG